MLVDLTLYFNDIFACPKITERSRYIMETSNYSKRKHNAFKFKMRQVSA